MTDSEPSDDDHPKPPTTTLAVLDPSPSSALVVPSLIADLGEVAALHLLFCLFCEYRLQNMREARRGLRRTM
jgi:hypothetical protein